MHRSYIIAVSSSGGCMKGTSGLCIAGNSPGGMPMGCPGGNPGEIPKDRNMACLSMLAAYSD